jgi:hypothetical protein
MHYKVWIGYESIGSGLFICIKLIFRFNCFNKNHFIIEFFLIP